MKETVTLSRFRDSFRELGRDNFTYDGLEALFNFIEEIDDDCGVESELDPIDLCCSFTEYQGLAEFQDDYDADEYKTIEDIENHTSVIRISDEAFIIQAFSR